MGALNSRLITGEGTPEALWRECFDRRPLAQVGIASLVDGSAVVHIVAPHPDDEILGCAGLIRQASRLGARVRILAVTDGEASHPRSRRWRRDALALVRTRESIRALERLSVHARRERLAIPDGTVRRHESELAQVIVKTIARGDTVVVPWRLDGHPDHEATGRAGCLAAGTRGARFVEVPIWGWHWLDPTSGAFPWHRAAALPLDAGDQRAKAFAIKAFRSQLQADPSTGERPVLPDFVLARLQRPFEVVLL